MRTTPRKLALVAAALGFALALTSCDPPTTVHTAVSYSCRIKSNNIFVPDVDGSTTSSYDTTAPPTVAPNGGFNVKIVPEPFTVDGTPTSDGTVTQVSNLVWRVPVPAGSTLTSQTIAGWANVGAGTPTVAVSGNDVVVTVPGPIPANTTATLPTLTLGLKATGAEGTHIVPKVGGTSTSSPGLTFNVRVTGTIVGTLNPTFSCYPNPNPALHDITVKTPA